MDRETAIDLLDNLLGMVEDNHESDYDTAIKMGIDAIKALPTAPNTSNALSALDCIERQATIDALCDNCDTVDAVCAHFPCKRYLSIENLPSVQTDMSGNMSGTHKSHDCISRQAAVDAFNEQNWRLSDIPSYPICKEIRKAAQDTIRSLPSVQPERMTNRQWVDFLSAQFDISRTSAKEMLHGMMRWKKEDNFKKLFNGGKT